MCLRAYMYARVCTYNADAKIQLNLKRLIWI